jgi:hypothetical protein
MARRTASRTARHRARPRSAPISRSACSPARCSAARRDGGAESGVSPPSVGMSLNSCTSAPTLARAGGPRTAITV